MLRTLGLKQYRVRVHNQTLARIEVLPGDIELVIREVSRRVISDRFHELGFKYITVDLNGYRTGSMNEVLES